MVSSVDAGAAGDGLAIAGSDRVNALFLDVDSLPSLAIAFDSVNSASVYAVADADFTLSAGLLEVAGQQFELSGFDHAGLTGGVSNNTFSYYDWGGSVEFDGGTGGFDTCG